MAKTSDKSQSSSSLNLKAFLISSVKFWFAISIASCTLSLVFLSLTTCYTPGLGTPFSVITLHCLVFLYHKRFRALMAGLPLSPLFGGHVILMAAVYAFMFPDMSLAGMCFLICLTVDILAIIQILQPPICCSVALGAIASAALRQSLVLYGLWGGCLMFVFATGVFVLNLWLEIAIKDSKKLRRG
ncbi:hypothetical protein LguiA_003350 [Lonicera macranthoides]